MNQRVSLDSLSRIDKLFLDQGVLGLDEALGRRARRGIAIAVGNDIPTSYGLQLALLTAVNLGAKCFAGNVAVYADAATWLAPCTVPVTRATTLGEAVTQLGGKIEVLTGQVPGGRHLIVGNATTGAGSIRLTYDGWGVVVGPAAKVDRLAERDHCPIAGIAAAAIAVGEIFADFAGINVTATRRVVELSLWRPDLPREHGEWSGNQLLELPLAIAVFGLGHLGQAYLWGLASLRYPDPGKATVLLCDDDKVESANVETGALLTASSVSLLKTRAASAWLEARGISTRLLERRVDDAFRRTNAEPVIGLSGFDDNRPRQWLAGAGFHSIFDSGLGGEAHNFDTIAYHAWPNPRAATDIWKVESEEEQSKRQAQREKRVAASSVYQEVEADECGRLLLAGKSIAIPFVGAMASSIVLAEMLKSVNGGPVFSDITMRLCLAGTAQFNCGHLHEQATPIRGLAVCAAHPAAQA